MKKTVSYSAPAKVILSGEHAVVYGKPALVSAIDLRLEFTLAPKSPTILSRSDQDGRLADASAVKKIEKAVKDYLKKEKINFSNKNYSFKINSNIPVGRGLGSSAALSVAAAAAFLRFYTGHEFEKETVNQLAYQVEKYFHKNPSGVDNSTSCFGGLIFYRKEFEFLKNISVLNLKIPKKIEENLYLIDNGKPKESTLQMVDLVGKKYNQKPHLVEEVLNNIEKTTKRMVVAIVKEDVNFFQQCIVDNQVYLELLDVVSKKAREMLKDLGEYGVGKITGAGGRKERSGFMLFFAHKKKEFENYCKNKKISYFKFNQSHKGVRREP